ncbi:MAG: adenylate kinase [Clostridiaceae bacterium]
MKLILLGPPGAGKGTQAKSISNEYNIPHISTGDIFRKNISEKTALGIEAKGYIDKGLLVPDELTVRIVEDRLKSDDCSRGYLLDGFPRTIYQAEELEKLDILDCVLLLQVPDEFILSRMTGRRVCAGCGASFHITNNPPKIEGVCDLCGGELVQRKDDKKETVAQRIQVYKNQTEPLVNFYKDKGILKTVDGTLKIEEVFKSIVRILKEI